MKRALLAFFAMGILVGAFFRRTAQRDAVPNSYVTSKTKLAALSKTQPEVYEPEELSIKFRITITLVMIIIVIAWWNGIEAAFDGKPPWWMYLINV